MDKWITFVQFSEFNVFFVECKQNILGLKGSCCSVSLFKLKNPDKLCFCRRPSLLIPSFGSKIRYLFPASAMMQNNQVESVVLLSLCQV